MLLSFISIDVATLPAPLRKKSLNDKYNGVFFANDCVSCKRLMFRAIDGFKKGFSLISFLPNSRVGPIQFLNFCHKRLKLIETNFNV